ncbi:bacteriocin ABC transporter [Spiroplasma sabaudiense Ar-1343]|uniref:Bacteriocin ABC transporter n=1 Tax=Spiroplasma sabaudiense Ar-1343 TaxID=1276257 RepID=W6AJ43_9MOLU|nr:cysteine peptidase family C39 domain-containing protein [Spiroplasma sabaudiense]AHI53724.1 bacteriocin ABC transporter [Spiroplasma sabaudiense Ar-1343]
MYPFVHQQTQTDCGFAVISMLVEYFQKSKLSIDYLKFLFNADENYLSIQKIEGFFNYFEIESKSYHCGINDLILSLKTGPVVALITNSKSENHFIVIYKLLGSNLVIADPNEGRLRKISLINFENSFLNVIIKLKKRKTWKKPKTNFVNNFKILKGHWFFILFLSLFSLVLDLSIIVSNTFLKNFFDKISTYSGNDMISFFGGYIIIFLSYLFLSFWQTVLLRNIFQKITIYENQRFLKLFLSIDYETFTSINPTNWYLKFNQINRQIEIVVIRFFTYINNFIIMVISLILLFGISDFLFIFVLIENIIILIISRTYQIFKQSNSYSIKNSELLYQRNIKESIEGFLTIKTNNVKEKISKNVYETFIENVKQTKKTTSLSINFESLEYLVSKIFYIVIFYIAAIKISSNEITVNNLIYYSVLAFQINKFFSCLQPAFGDLCDLKIIHESLSILKTKEMEKISNSNFSSCKIENISVNDVTKFIKGNLSLKNKTLFFNHHSLLKGANASGKTTLLLLISGIYNNFVGDIKLNNIDIKNYELAKKIRYLGTNCYLFTETILELWNNTWINDNSLSSELSEITDIIIESKINPSLTIENNGSNLSSGQKQIVNFIGILKTDFDVYLLDECLSNIDENIKKRLLKLFLKIHKDKVIIYCDHDTSIEHLFSNLVVI